MDGNIIAWLVLGLVSGALAKFIMPGRDPGGLFVTIAIGIVGSFVGGYVGGQLMGLNMSAKGDLSFPSIGTAVFGALILLAGYRMLKR